MRNSGDFVGIDGIATQRAILLTEHLHVPSLVLCLSTCSTQSLVTDQAPGFIFKQLCISFLFRWFRCLGQRTCVVLGPQYRLPGWDGEVVFHKKAQSRNVEDSCAIMDHSRGESEARDIQVSVVNFPTGWLPRRSSQLLHSQHGKAC